MLGLLRMREKRQRAQSLAYLVVIGLAGCTTTTIGLTDAQPGHELALRVTSGKSKAMLTNHGPGPVWLSVDSPKDAFDIQKQIDPGPHEFRLSGKTMIIVSNPQREGAQPANFTLVLGDPCTLEGGARPMNPQNAPARPAATTAPQPN